MILVNQKGSLKTRQPSVINNKIRKQRNKVNWLTVENRSTMSEKAGC